VSGSVSEVPQATGYARVLVTLAPDAAASVGTGPQALSGYFSLPEPHRLQFASLALAGARTAQRRPPPKHQRLPPAMRVFPRLGLAIGLVDRAGAAALERDPQVRQIALAHELSLIRPVASQSARAPADIAWGLRRMRIPELWNAGLRGDGVMVGHLDTGMDGKHPDLQPAIAAFAEFDPTGNPVAKAKPRDGGTLGIPKLWHGTHTAGIIAARPGRRGAIGVAPGARLASALVIEGGQVIDRVLGGLEWVLEQNVRVLSMSLGLRGYTPAFQALIDALRRANVLPVIAIGNDGPTTGRSPGNYVNVLSVGAMDERNKVADFSGSQSFDRADNPTVPMLVAPGVSVVSAAVDGYALMDGTSMATPHVAGLAGRLLQAQPKASAEQLESAILQSCTRPATMPAERAGRGVPDAVQALSILTGQPPAVGVATARRAVRSPKPDPALSSSANGEGRKGGVARAGKRRAPARRTSRP
jgi:subtilisin